jgi:flagellar hook assembly protein FlgD
LECPANVNLAVYDASGRQVALLEAGEKAKGEHSLNWNTKVSNGVYLCKLNIGDKTYTKKFIITE